MLGHGLNLITTVIGFGLSAIFIVFVCTRLICRTFRPPESRQMPEIGTRMEFELTEHRINGLEPAVVAAIPTMKFGREAFSSTEDAQCAICLGEYEEREVLRIMPKCRHSFHLSCIDIWLRKQYTCPVCRLSVHGSYEHTRPTILGRPQSFDEQEDSVVEPSQIFLLHTGSRSEGTTTHIPGNPGSVTMNPGSSISGEAVLRS